eukprot:scaffold60_cov325-Pavlova_lutheri.AAC.6
MALPFKRASFTGIRDPTRFTPGCRGKHPGTGSSIGMRRGRLSSEIPETQKISSAFEEGEGCRTGQTTPGSRWTRPVAPHATVSFVRLKPIPVESHGKGTHAKGTGRQNDAIGTERQARNLPTVTPEAKAATRKHGRPASRSTPGKRQVSKASERRPHRNLAHEKGQSVANPEQPKYTRGRSRENHPRR